MSSTDSVYAIFLHRKADTVTPPTAIAGHLDYLRVLDDRGLLVIAGPFIDYPGGQVVVRAESREAAEHIALTDPFIRDGLRTYEIREWRLANRENNYLG